MTETLDLFNDAIEMPPRSRLFSLQLEGRGTCRQESMLSYLHRLARAHGVPPMVLITHSVVPVCSIEGARFPFSFSKSGIRTADGCVKYARELVQALTLLTRAEGLADGTFLHWEPLLDPHGGGLLHPKRRWCPSCLADANDAGEAVCYDLLWSSDAVDYCAIHLTRLASNCPSCGDAQPFLNESLSFGRCHACGDPLGRREGLWEEAPITAQARFNVDAVAAMVSAGAGAQGLANVRSMVRALRGLIDAYFGGSPLRFEEALGLPRNTSGWFSGAARPRLKSVLDLCFRVGVLPTDLLSPSFEPRMHGGKFRCGTRPAARIVKGISDERRVELVRFVDGLIASDSDLNIKEAVAKCGTTKGHFKYYLPETFQRLADHVKAKRTFRKKARIDAKCAEAAEIARQLFAESTHVPRRRLDHALARVGLSIRSPSVRKAAFSELRRLRERGVEEALRAESGTSC
jgi:hypothetical protein